MKRLMMILVTMVALVGSMAHAALDNKGKDFIFTFLPGLGGGTVELHLTSDVATNVTVQYPVNSPTFNTTVPVAPGNITIVTLPATARNWTPNTVVNNAVHAFAVDEFVAYTINRQTVTSDAALGLPVDTMNTEYLIMDYNPAFVGAQFNVFAGFDNTTVTITPKTAMVGRPAGVPFTVVLQRGQGYFAQGASTAVTNTLTGTIISADRPIGVTNGEGCTQVPRGTIACDHTYEVAQPVQSWGNSVLVSNLPNRPNGSIYRILASRDGTTITQDGVFPASLNRTQFFETPILPGSHIFAANKPIFVAQFMTGQGSPGAVSGDPAMGNMIPTEQYLRSYTFSTVGAGQFATNFVNIIARNTDVTGGTILLDGASIPAGDFTPIGASGFSSTVKALTSGTHNTSSSSGAHGITVEGYNDFDSYLYPGGALFQFINPVGDANPPIVTVSTTPGPPPSASGTATDNRPTEDTNSNGILDPGEDLNSNGQIDRDAGIFFVELEPGATNLTLTVNPFVPGAGSVNFTVSRTNSSLSGSGTLRVTDGAGNFTLRSINLGTSTATKCDANGDGSITKADINIIFAARGQQATGPNDPRDANNDGIISVNDSRICAIRLQPPVEQ